MVGGRHFDAAARPAVAPACAGTTADGIDYTLLAGFAGLTLSF